MRPAAYFMNGFTAEGLLKKKPPEVSWNGRESIFHGATGRV